MAERAAQINRDTVQAFNDAYARRDMAALESLVDDNARWLINGPVELLHFCGERRGKSAVLDMVRRVAPEQFKVIKFVPEMILIDGDRASTLGKLSGERVDDGRVISYRLAQFMRFNGRKIVEYCSLIDSFDAAQQVLGRPITLGGSEPFENDTLIAV